MNTSVNPQTLKTERLTDAFQIFNELSINLSDSYQELQKREKQTRKARKGVRALFKSLAFSSL